MVVPRVDGDHEVLAKQFVVSTALAGVLTAFSAAGEVPPSVANLLSGTPAFQARYEASSKQINSSATQSVLSDEQKASVSQAGRESTEVGLFVVGNGSHWVLEDGDAGAFRGRVGGYIARVGLDLKAHSDRVPQGLLTKEGDSRFYPGEVIGLSLCWRSPFGDFESWPKLLESFEFGTPKTQEEEIVFVGRKPKFEAIIKTSANSDRLLSLELRSTLNKETAELYRTLTFTKWTSFDERMIPIEGTARIYYSEKPPGFDKPVVEEVQTHFRLDDLEAPKQGQPPIPDGTRFVFADESKRAFEFRQGQLVETGDFSVPKRSTANWWPWIGLGIAFLAIGGVVFAVRKGQKKGS